MAGIYNILVSRAAQRGLSGDALCRPPALAQNLVTEEWNDIRKQTPIVMGEFGCNANWYPNASMCSPHVRQLQVTPTPPRVREVSAAALSSFALSLFCRFLRVFTVSTSEVSAAALSPVLSPRRSRRSRAAPLASQAGSSGRTTPTTFSRTGTGWWMMTARSVPCWHRPPTRTRAASLPRRLRRLVLRPPAPPLRCRRLLACLRRSRRRARYEILTEI